MFNVNNLTINPVCLICHCGLTFILSPIFGSIHPMFKILLQR